MTKGSWRWSGCIADYVVIDRIKGAAVYLAAWPRVHCLGMLKGDCLMGRAMEIRTRIVLTFFALLFVCIHLASEYFGGGVRSHHLLNRPDFPAMSNWWGLLVLPALAWFMVARVQAWSAASRLFSGFPSSAIPGFIAALIYGGGLAAAFAYGYEAITSDMFIGMFVLALAFPIYRGEYVLGFVFGMTFTFGAVLPTLVAMVIALISAVLHSVFRLVLRVFWRFASRGHGRIPSKDGASISSGEA